MSMSRNVGAVRRFLFMRLGGAGTCTLNGSFKDIADQLIYICPMNYAYHEGFFLCFIQFLDTITIRVLLLDVDMLICC